jgi:hypothetical protein
MLASTHCSHPMPACHMAKPLESPCAVQSCRDAHASWCMCSDNAQWTTRRAGAEQSAQEPNCDEPTSYCHSLRVRTATTLRTHLFPSSLTMQPCSVMPCNSPCIHARAIEHVTDHFSPEPWPRAALFTTSVTAHLSPGICCRHSVYTTPFNCCLFSAQSTGTQLTPSACSRLPRARRSSPGSTGEPGELAKRYLRNPVFQLGAHITPGSHDSWELARVDFFLRNRVSISLVHRTGPMSACSAAP